MKRVLIIVIAVALVLSLGMGTALAKNDKSNGNNKSTEEQVTAKANKIIDKLDDRIAKGKEKQELRAAFKTAVSPYLATIKDNKTAFAKAGGLDKLEGIHDSIDDALQKLIAGQIPVTQEQLSAIKAEIAKIKSYRVSLKTDKAAQVSAWQSYIAAKKTYATDAAIAALQKVISLQQQRIDARKGIFASMSNILAIINQALTNPVPEPSPAPSASQSASPSPSISPEASSSASAA
jgi:hypothetical protein